MAKQATKRTVNTNSQTASIMQQSISAINKADSVLNSVKELPSIFEELTIKVEEIKAGLDLGLKEYEIAIQEKKEKLDEDYSSSEQQWKDAVELAKVNFEIFSNNMRKQEEELKYANKLAIERENLETAKTIVEKTSNIIVPANTFELHEKALVDLKAELGKEYGISKANELKKLKDEQAATIAELEVNNKLLAKDVEALTKEVATKEAEIIYLKSQIDKMSKAEIEKIASLKSDVVVQNDNTGRK